MKIPANEIREGDMLPGLDNGYVFEDPEPADDCVNFRDGFMPVAIGEGYLFISFHDAEGEENYMVVREDFEIEVDR